MAQSALVVCVPACNEADRLPHLLAALAQQTLQGCPVVVALNNTTDHSRDAIAATCLAYPVLDVIVDETTFAPAMAHAGSARRRAMDCAADRAGPHGLIVTTDADTRPPPHWLASNQSALVRGLDIVGGMIVIDEAEPLQTSVAAARKLADRYWAKVRAIEDAVDPVAWDPPPRHGDHTGASLALSVAAYRRSGGVQTIPTGEDRALVAAVVRQGGRLAHPADIWTRVSPRTEGRAIGGMAEHMTRLQADCLADMEIRLPSFAQWQCRARWRRGIRDKGGAALVVELEQTLPPMVDDMVLNANAFEPVA